jgi:hypothetical protein
MFDLTNIPTEHLLEDLDTCINQLKALESGNLSEVLTFYALPSDTSESILLQVLVDEICDIKEELKKRNLIN